MAIIIASRQPFLRVHLDTPTDRTGNIIIRNLDEQSNKNSTNIKGMTFCEKSIERKNRMFLIITNDKSTI